MTEFLSSSVLGSKSAISVIGGPQVLPPSVERLTVWPLDAASRFGLALSLTTSADAYAVPSGENETHGSDERGQGPPSHSVTSGVVDAVNVMPPSRL